MKAATNDAAPAVTAEHKNDDIDIDLIRAREALEAKCDELVMGKRVRPAADVKGVVGRDFAPGVHTLGACQFLRVDENDQYEGRVPRYGCDDDATTNLVLKLVMQEGVEFRIRREGNQFLAGFVRPNGAEYEVAEATYGEAVMKAAIAVKESLASH